ncbi:MAG: hypothetical protein VR70_03895 [Rhodospirillaceae bacterium BRH_c57]|nr:MAG: hypothetical protein VR70_03895 [Rhodospirillaceae bacterium BRH_c57]
MANIAQVGSDMLRAAANFFRAVGRENPALTDQMDRNAKAYEDVADMLEKDPTMEVATPDAPPPAG